MAFSKRSPIKFSTNNHSKTPFLKSPMPKPKLNKMLNCCLISSKRFNRKWSRSKSKCNWMNNKPNCKKNKRNSRKNRRISKTCNVCSKKRPLSKIKTPQIISIWTEEFLIVNSTIPFQPRISWSKRNWTKACRCLFVQTRSWNTK